MSSTIVFDILARDRASDKFDHIGDSATRSSGKLKKFAAVGAAALGAGAVIAGKALWDMGKAAMEDEKAQALLSKALENNAGATKNQVSAVEDWISAQGKALGVTDDELRPALSKLVTATKDVGEAQKLASLAMDVSAGSGKSLDAVSTALMKAQNGQVSGLSRLGIETKNAAGETLTFEQATKKMADTFGGSASKAADTTAGKFGRLKLAFDETKETIGAKLLPIADRLGSWLLNEGGPAAQKFGDWFQQKIMPPLRDFAESVAPKARAIMDALKGAFQDAEPFMDLMGKVLGNVVVPGLKKLLDIAGPALVGQIKLIGKGLEAVGEMGTWMWNNALQPAFKFIVGGVAKVLEMFSALLDTMGNVPGFGWAEKAADKMAAAADKARAMADGIKKIPPSKTVNITVAYKYTGLRAPGGSGPTRSGLGDDFMPRAQVATIQSATTQFFNTLADGMKKGGKKLDKVLAASRDSLKSKLQGIRDDMASLSGSVASALNQADFSGTLEEHLASLTGNNGALSKLMAVFQNLKSGASKDYLSSLMQSGNIGLATALAEDPAALAQASSLYDANAAMAKGLGDQTAQAVLGDKIDAALTREIKKLLDEMKDAPDKTARKLRKELADLRLVVEGLSSGQKAHLKGGW